MSITIVLPWPPQHLSPNARLHWAALAKAKKSYRAECGWQAKAQGVHALKAPRLKVSFTFFPPSKRRIDIDNCIARMKSGIDGLADVLGVDDSKWEMSFKLEEQVGGMVKVLVQEVQA